MRDKKTVFKVIKISEDAYNWIKKKADINGRFLYRQIDMLALADKEFDEGVDKQYETDKQSK